MKYLKLFEKYSLPDVVESLSQEVTNFVCKNFDRWLSRKSLANYSEIHQFTPIQKTRDFPVSIIKVKTIYVLSDKYGDIVSAGRGFLFRDENDKSYTPMSSTIKKNGSLEIGIEIKVYVDRNKKSFSYDEIKESIDPIVVHELLHTYQFYKEKLKKIDSAQKTWALGLVIADFIYAYMDLDNFCGFLRLAYILTDKYETSAYLSMLHSKEGDNWTNYLEYTKMSYEDLLEIIGDELVEAGYTKEDVYESFMDRHNGYCKTIESKQDKINAKNFDELIYYLYEIVMYRKNNLIKKINKVKSISPTSESIVHRGYKWTKSGRYEVKRLEEMKEEISDILRDCEDVGLIISVVQSRKDQVIIKIDCNITSGFFKQSLSGYIGGNPNFSEIKPSIEHLVGYMKSIGYDRFRYCDSISMFNNKHAVDKRDNILPPSDRSKESYIGLAKIVFYEE